MKPNTVSRQEALNLKKTWDEYQGDPGRPDPQGTYHRLLTTVIFLYSQLDKSRGSELAGSPTPTEHSVTEDEIKVMLTYISLLATYGEGNPKGQAYQMQFTDPVNIANLIKVDLFYRELAQSGIFGPST